jgi:hypothetical protein
MKFRNKMDKKYKLALQISKELLEFNEKIPMEEYEK